MEKTIEIPEGYEARIEDNKVILEPKVSEDERIRRELICQFSLISEMWFKNIFNGSVTKEQMIAYLERQKGIVMHTPRYAPPEQKPAEWSEEEMGVLIDCISALQNGSHWILADKLSSLRPQPKGEIYKSAKRDLTIRFMNYLDENRPDGKMSLSSGECEDIDKAFIENDWAKILRYAEKYSPSWKPSKEQMRVFLKATPINLMPEELPVYNSLYNDLQKLF